MVQAVSSPLRELVRALPVPGRARRPAKASALAAVFVLAAAPAGAARQGELAAASRGSVAIVVSVAGRVDVSGIADTSLTTADGTAAAQQAVCISSNSATRQYDLEASGEVAGNTFIMTAQDGSTVPLDLSWTDAAGTANSLSPGLPLHGLRASQGQCSPETRSTLAMAAPTAVDPVTGSITLTVSPL